MFKNQLQQYIYTIIPRNSGVLEQYVAMKTVGNLIVFKYQHLKKFPSHKVFFFTQGHAPLADIYSIRVQTATSERQLEVNSSSLYYSLEMYITSFCGCGGNLMYAQKRYEKW